MNVRILFVKMDIKTDNIIFTPFVTGESVNIFRPFLNVFTAGDRRVVGTMFQINCLIPEGKAVHPFPASSEDYIDNGAAIRLLVFTFHLLIRVSYPTFRKCLLDSPWNTFRLIYCLDHASMGDFKIEMRSGAVIVATFDGNIPASVGPTPLMLVGLIG